MRSHAGVAAKMFDLLAGEGINIQMISTSEIKISVVVDRDEVERAVRVLHAGFSVPSMSSWMAALSEPSMPYGYSGFLL